MFIVTSDPCAADDLVRLLRDHGCRAHKRTPFVAEIEPPATEAEVERLFAEWHETRDDVYAELITRARPRI